MSDSPLESEGPLDGVLEGDGVFRCRALGFGIRLPLGWHLLTGDAFTLAALKIAAAERKLIVTKYPEPFDGLNPNLTLIVRTKPRMGPGTPLGILRMAIATMPHMLPEFSVETEPGETTLGGRPVAAMRVRYRQEVAPGQAFDIRSYMAVTLHGEVMYQFSYGAPADGVDAYDEAMELFFETLEFRGGDEPTRYPWALLVANGLMQRYAMAPIRSRHQLEATMGVALAQAGLNRVTSQLAPLVTACFRTLRTPRIDGDIPVGASKVGGYPDLPEGVVWPDDGRRPISFVAQVRLSEFKDPFPGCPLPADGLLSIFCNADVAGRQNRNSIRVIYTAAGTQDLRRCRPQQPHPGDPTYAPSQLEFFEAVSMPSPYSPLLEELNLDDQEMETYSHFHSGLLGSVEDPFHQILGYGTETCEDDCLPGSQCPPTEDSPDGWLLLLQLGADPETRFGWPDGSLLDLWVRRSELESRQFREPVVMLHGEPSIDEDADAE